MHFFCISSLGAELHAQKRAGTSAAQSPAFSASSVGSGCGGSCCWAWLSPRNGFVQFLQWHFRMAFRWVVLPGQTICAHNQFSQCLNLPLFSPYLHGAAWHYLGSLKQAGCFLLVYACLVSGKKKWNSGWCIMRDSICSSVFLPLAVIFLSDQFLVHVPHLILYFAFMCRIASLVAFPSHCCHKALCPGRGIEKKKK